MGELIKRRRWDLSEWQSVSARQARSGLSVVAFCARESINLSSFYRCRERWGESPSSGLSTSVTKSPSSSQASFVDLGQLQSSTASMELRLELGNGLSLTLVRH